MQASLWISETAEQTNKNEANTKKKEKFKRVDTLVDVDTDSDTESSDGKEHEI